MRKKKSVTCPQIKLSVVPKHFLLTAHFRRNTKLTPYIDLLNNPAILHSLHMAVPSENIFVNILVHTLRRSTQLPYPCIRDFIPSSDTQQTSGVIHLYSPNPRPLFLPPYDCITTISKGWEESGLSCWGVSGPVLVLFLS